MIAISQICFYQSQSYHHEQQERDDPRGEGRQGAGGVSDRAPQGSHRQREEQHPGPHQLQVCHGSLYFMYSTFYNF